MKKQKPKFYAKSEVRDDVVERPLAWDTETDGLNGDLLCITYSIPASEGIIRPEEADQFLDFAMSFPYPHVWYAHNGQYDWRYILEKLLNMPNHVDLLNRTESDVFQITVWHDEPTGDWRVDKDIAKTVFRDSMALFPGSLDDFTKHFADKDLRKLKDNIDFSKERFDIDNHLHVEYAIRDAVSLRSAMDGFRMTFKDIFGCWPGVTTAGSAMKAWQYSIKDDARYYCPSLTVDDYITPAYYGGLVFLTSTEDQGACSTYDINSSYPAQMINNLMPAGKPVRVNTIKKGKLGIYDVVMQSPDDIVVPIIPSRDAGGHMQWRRGRIETRITSVEIEFALQNGYRLLEVNGGIYFEETVSPFKDFIAHCQKMRFDHKDTAIEVLAKLMQNSLYGKFATKQQRTQLFIIKDETQFANATPVNSELGIWAEQIYDLNMKRMPQWSAFITAYARIALLSAAYSVGIKNVAYGDTDSITVKNNCDHSVIPQHPTDYGYFKLEKTWSTFRAAGPKVYSGQLDNNDINNHNKKGDEYDKKKDLRGKYTGKCKGIPKKLVDEKMLEQIFRGKKIEVEYESTPKFTAILKGKAYAGQGTITRTRTISNLDNSANWETYDDKKVRPRLAG